MAVGVFEIPPELDAALETISTDPSADGFTILLGLRDLLKKPAAGRALGRTVISFEETLQASEFVEETGLILFNHLAQSYPPFSSLFAAEAVRRQSALASLLRLQDDLRYHRFPPILS
ncbi:hypothetical protein EHM69_05900 [candidate division KSB1 bacterium]|nr:MAG: hypothetical protein EHM69_05900 [candidate division KSB1 bacterium]